MEEYHSWLLRGHSWSVASGCCGCLVTAAASYYMSEGDVLDVNQNLVSPLLDGCDCGLEHKEGWVRSFC